MPNVEEHPSTATQQPRLSEALILGASLIGRPTGESISRNSIGDKEVGPPGNSYISLVREMGQLTPCALLERAGIKRSRRTRLALSLLFISLCTMLPLLTP